jgi:hypothetical protein
MEPKYELTVKTYFLTINITMHKVYYSQLGKFGYVEYSDWADLLEGLRHNISVRFDNNTTLQLTLKDIS